MTFNQKFFFFTMIAFYVGSGINHFAKTDFYLNLSPAWLPSNLFLVYLSGVAEIILGILLLPVKTRKAAAWLIIAMLVVFFFVIHVPMTIQFHKTGDEKFMVSLIRLPIQFLLIWWAWLYTKPFKT